LATYYTYYVQSQAGVRHMIVVYAQESPWQAI